MASLDVVISFLGGPILGPLVITIFMAFISRTANLELLLFGQVPGFLSKVLTEKNLVHAFAGAIVSIKRAVLLQILYVLINISCVYSNMLA